MRVAPPRIDGRVVRAPRPAAGEPGADAHRQTSFVLGGEVDLVELGLELEGVVAAASGGSRFRKQPTAAALAMWSRGWLSRVTALHAVQVANYAGAIPLVRAAADYLAAEIALLESGAAEWQEWLEQGGVGAAHDLHAAEFRLHAFRSAETLASHPELGRVYREASDLAMPHFGATLLIAGYETTPERVLVAFGDRDFHLGLAEIVLGWLLALGREQLNAVENHPEFLAAPEEAAAAAWMKGATAALERRDRCEIETVEREGERRLLVQGWRKRPGDAARRILL